MAKDIGWQRIGRFMTRASSRRTASSRQQVVKAAGGKFLVRGGEVVAFQAGLKERTVVVEFPSFEQALATFQSEAYQKALAVLGDGAERDARVVAGVDD